MDQVEAHTLWTEYQNGSDHQVQPSVCGEPALKFLVK